MTSQLELTDLGKKFLINEILKHCGNEPHLIDLIAIANHNIADDKNYLDLEAYRTLNNRAYRIEFTKDHLKFKDKI